MRAGLPHSTIVTFDRGFPSGDVTWSVSGLNGDEIAGGSITPEPGSISVQITVQPDDNQLSGGNLIATRFVTWTYVVNGETIVGHDDYEITAPIPYGATPRGVRNLLGVPQHNLEDEEIDLIEAYWEFKTLAGDLSAVPQDDSEECRKITRAIEATAALSLLPSMPLRIAEKESSGTEQYTRSKVDWAALRSELDDLVERGRMLITNTPTPMTPIFLVATSPDRLTG